MRFSLLMVFLFVIVVAVMGHCKEKKIAFVNNKKIILYFPSGFIFT